MANLGERQVVPVPQTELGKLLSALVQAIADDHPNAFREVDIIKAIQQADGTTSTSDHIHSMWDFKK